MKRENHPKNSAAIGRNGRPSWASPNARAKKNFRAAIAPLRLGQNPVAEIIGFYDRAGRCAGRDK
jgi:hypothetical protein